MKRILHVCLGALLLLFALNAQAQLPAPTISSFSPSSGPVGTLVTVNGTNFSSLNASITIGGKPAVIVAVGGTTMTALVMPGATTGGITYAQFGAGAATAAGNFTVTTTPYPSLQQGAKLTATGETGNATLGAASAISADGNTAIVSGSGDNANTGGAWIFTRSGGAWTKQGSKLVPTDNIGSSMAGYSLSISADGNTAIMGGLSDNGTIGAAWIFTRSGGVWTQQGSKLTANDESGNAQFGSSVSMSADGNTVAIGGFYDNNNIGAVWVFTRSGSTWTQQGNKLTPSDNSGAAFLGQSVAISADGNTIIAGGNSDAISQGAAWIFVRNNQTWSQQGNKLYGTGSVTTPQQGYKVAISADGNTAISTGYQDNNSLGAAWVFTRSGANWTQQGNKLVGTGAVTGYPQEGSSVTLSADGNVALIGGFGDNNSTGAIWTFKRTNGAWAQQGSKIVGTGSSSNSPYQGYSVAVSADGTTAVVGGTGDNNYAGAVWAFTANDAMLDTLTTSAGTLSPVFAKTTTSYTVVVNNNVSSITFTPRLDNTTASVTVNGIAVNDTTASAPVALNVGNNAIPVVVTAPAALSTQTYNVTVIRSTQATITSVSPSSGPVGTLVTLTGTGLLSPTAITIGGVPAVVLSSTYTTATALVMPGATSSGVSFSSVNGTATGSFTVGATPYPSLQQGAKLVATDYSRTSRQGYSVAVSADGNTAIVGGWGDNTNQGAAWIYTRIGGTWTQQGSKLVGTGNTGAAYQGWSVAISADGNTAIVGGYKDNNGTGAAWVYTRANGAWTQQGAKLIAGDAFSLSYMGYSIGLSADGNTAILGGYGDNSGIGASWIFTRSNGVWTQQGNKLTANDNTSQSDQGYSVSLSADGNTAAVGGYFDNSGQGAVWIYTRSNSTWTQQGTKLTATGEAGTYADLGTSVALSADGNTVISGGNFDNSGIGAAWVFARANGTWTQQGNKLVGAGYVGSPREGGAVSISADGNTAIIGGGSDNGIGASWIFTRNNGTWTQRGSKLIGAGYTLSPGMGVSVAMSADGNTALMGGSGDNTNVGAAWVYTAKDATLSALTLSTDTISPVFNPATTAYTVAVGNTISNISITPTVNNTSSTVTVNGTAVSSGSASSPVALNVGNNVINVVVTAADGVTTQTYALTITRAAPVTIASVSPVTGPVGTLVTINGTGLSYQTSLKIGGVPAIIVNNTGISIQAMVMPGTTTGAISFPVESGAPSGGTFTVSSTPFPSQQQGNNLQGTGFAGQPQEGTSVAVSADGNTAIIGGYQDNSGLGAAWIFTRSNGAWSQQGTKLLGADGTGSGIAQGYSVAISADGNTALVGAYKDNNTTGAVFVYTRSNGTWTQQGSKLTGTGLSAGHLGYSVALSADGNTAIAGAYTDNFSTGAAVIFTRSNGTWTQQGAKLVGTGASGADQGNAVALSADGNTAMVGGYFDNSNQGAAWVYTRSNGVWTQQSGKLVGTGNTGAARQGGSVALSADGNTAAIGGLTDNTSTGATWIFTRSNGTWTQQGNKLVGVNSINLAGEGRVGLSADGNVLVVGAYRSNGNNGGSCIFTRNGTTWTQKSFILPGTGSAGSAVALSSDATTAIIGNPFDAGNAGSGAGNVGDASVFISNTTPPALSAVNIASNNANTSYAKVGNVVTLTFTASAAIVAPTVTIAGHSTGLTFANTTGNTWTTGYTIQSSDTQGIIPFSITVTDLAGNVATPVTATTDGSKVTFDITAPATPTNLTGTPGLQQVVLTWTANTEADLQSYKIYSGTSAGSLTLLATVAAGATTYTNTVLTNGTVYYYSISAIDAAGNESAQSPAITVNTSAPQTIAFSAIPNSVYGASPITLGATASSGLAVTYTSSNTAVATVNGNIVTIISAGSTVITASQAGNGSTYQAATPVPQTLTVNKLTIAITADAKSKTYGAADPALTYTFTPALVAGDSFTGALVRATGENTGTYSIGQGTLALNSNYTISYAATNLIINKLPISITADAKSKIYGTTDPALTYTFSPGLVTGDSFTGTLVRVTGENAGTYSIGQGTLTLSSNYAITYAPALLTINKAPLTITANNQSRLYGAANPALTVSYSGFLNGEGTNYLISLPVASTTATAASLPGSYPITVSGAVAANYSISYVAGSLTVTPLTNAGMSNLAISTGALSPAFATGVYNYTVTAPVTVASLIVTANYDATASATLNGNSISNGASSFPIAISPGTTTITIIVTAQDGVTKLVYTINVIQATNAAAVTATNILSPNGDGKNDAWVIKDIQLYPNNIVTIYDRAGRVVYTRKGYNNDWQGTVNNAPLAQGTYYYVIQLDPTLTPIKGFVTILRNNN